MRTASSPTPGLGQKIAKGAAWMVLARWGIRGIGIISTIILARLLEPADFGLVALATITIGLLEVMGQFGFDLALIQRQSATRDHYDTVWTLTVLRSLLMALLLASFAQAIAEFYETPRLEAVVYALVAGVIAEGFQNVGIVNFRKDLQFHKEFRYLISQKLISFAVTITLAYMLRSYWALVCGIVVGKVAGLLLSYVMHSYRPRFSFGAIRDLFSFSKWTFIYHVFEFCGARFDSFVLGKFLGPKIVGIYTIATEITSIATIEIGWPIVRALYPGYSKLSSDKKAFAQVVLDSWSGLALVVIPCAVGVALVAEPLTMVFLGAKWRDAVPLIELLAFYGLLRAGWPLLESVCFALDKPHIVAALTAAGFIGQAAAIFLGFKWAGVEGVAWAMIVSAAFRLLAFMIVVCPLIGLSVLQLLHGIWRTIASAIVMFVAIILARDLFDHFSIGDVLRLLFTVGLGGTVFVLTHLSLWRLAGLPSGSEEYLADALRRVTSRLVLR